MPRESYVQAAFEAVCKEARQATGFYVSLLEEAPFYGGPEEGGWWGRDTRVVAYQYFPAEEQAEAARARVEGLASEMRERSRREHGDRCLRELDWLDARGLEPDWLPEPDGEAEYRVVVSEGIPEESYGCRQYS